MTYEQIKALYSLFITNVGNLINRFGKVYFPNPYISDVTAEDNLEDILINFEGFLPVEEYNKYEGFLFPILLLNMGNSKFRILDGCHRYAYTCKYPDSIILAIPIKDNVDGGYELLIPTEICSGSYTELYSFSVHGIPCVKVNINDLISFRKMYVRFIDLISKEMKNSSYFFKASDIVNLNVKAVNFMNRSSPSFAPSYQYLDEYGIIRHDTMNTNCSKQYVQSLYNLYFDDLEILYRDKLFYLDNTTVNIEIANTECWDQLYFDKESLIRNIKQNGIYFPITYRDLGNDVYRIMDGTHRFFACKDILQNSESSSKYLMISDYIVVNEPVSLYIPKDIYDRYSYMIEGEIESDILYENEIDSYLVSTSHTRSIKTIQLLLDRELNGIFDKGLFKVFNIKPARLFNGGVL